MARFRAKAMSARARFPLVVRTNLLTTNQATLETDTTGWTTALNCSIARTTAQAAQGSASLQVTATAAANTAPRTLSGLSGVPVVAGVTYTLLASFRAAVTTRTVRVDAIWYDAAGSSLSTTTSGTTASSTSAGWTQAALTMAAPVGAAFVAIRPHIAGMAASEVHYVDKVSIAADSSTIWTAP